MKKIMLLCIVSSLGFSQNAVTEAGKMMAKPAMPHKEANPSIGDNVVIDPKKRSDDWMQAYHFLQSQQTAINAVFVLHNGQQLSNILSIKAMDGGTLMVFELNTTSGTRFEVVKVEDINEIIQK